MKLDPEIVISDIKTYQIMSNNQNYTDRLFEAYKYIKKEKLNTYQKFITSDNNIVGLFSYYEITIFDRLKNPEYYKLIKNSWRVLHHDIEQNIKNPNLGDELASYGRLGYTPKRKEYIEQGFAVNCLTDEEKKIRDENQEKTTKKHNL